MAPNSNYASNILSTTIEEWTPELIDNIFKSSALLMKMKENSKTFSGGHKIVQPLTYRANGLATSYDGYDEITINDEEVATVAEYAIKEYVVPITWSSREDAQNDSKEKIIDLMKAKLENAKQAMVEDMSSGLYSDGTGNSSKDITGVVAAVASSGTYGGIDSSTETWWVSTVDSDSVALDRADMNTLYNSISKGGTDQPNLIVTTQTLYEAYETMLTPTLRYSSAELADNGFQSLMYKGKPMVFDEDCNSGVMYMFNTKYLFLKSHSRYNFTTTPMVQSSNQTAQRAFILWKGNLVCSARLRQGKLTNKTA